MRHWLEQMRYRLGCWLVPETRQLDDTLADLEKSWGLLRTKESELHDLESEKGVLQGQVEFLRRGLDNVTAQFDVVRAMSEQLYKDLKDANQKFIDYATGAGSVASQTADANQSLPDLMHPEYVISEMIRREAEGAFDSLDDMAPPRRH